MSLLCWFLSTILHVRSIHASDVITVLLSLPADVENQSQLQLKNAFENSRFDLKIHSLSEYRQRKSTNASDHGMVLAAGRESCAYTAKELQTPKVLCVLLSRQAFDEIQYQRDEASTRIFGAIVLDQPLSRQVKIAHAVFPSLQKFGVLSSEMSQQRDIDQDDWSLTVNTFNEDQEVVPQIVQAISDKDALVAVPDRNVYSTESLRSVLLTAFGYAKPVIGYSRAYVRAGALITTFTTPAQMFRQASEILNGDIANQIIEDNSVFEPRYFSIAHNPSIAKSLGLEKQFEFRSGHDYKDCDFAS